MTWPILALLSAVFAALTAILGKVGVQGIDSNLAVAIRTTVVVVFAWGLVLPQRNGAAMQAIPARAWLFLVLSGLATGLSWLFYYRALQLGPASRVAPVDNYRWRSRSFWRSCFWGSRRRWAASWAGC